MPKERLSASVDASLIAAGRDAVTAGRAKNLSVWVNRALELLVDHERRRHAMGEFLDHYEAGHGRITDTEMDEAYSWARGRAVTVEGAPSPGRRSGQGAA